MIHDNKQLRMEVVIEGMERNYLIIFKTIDYIISVLALTVAEIFA